MIFLDYASTNISPKFFSKDYGWHFNPNANYAFIERNMLQSCESRIKTILGMDKTDNGMVLFFKNCSDSVKWLHEKLGKSNFDFGFPDNKKVHDSLFAYESQCNFVNDYVLSAYPYTSHLNGSNYDISCVKKDERNYNLLDLTQTLGKTQIPDLSNFDAVCMSGHKIGCPDLSFLWISDRLANLIEAKDTVKNQYGLVHGTLNVASVLALTEAVENAVSKIENKIDFYYDLYCTLFFELERLRIKYKEHCGDTNSRSYAIVLLSFEGMNGEALQQYLARNNCFVGIAGSSCVEDEDYRVPIAYGMTKEEAENSIRISFGEETTVEDIKGFVDLVNEFRKKFVVGQHD